ncbi:2-C-methyl-D-erythritol 4-phosphate cytidylyltransferase [Limosilactobacillus fermentum]|uniref:2-C-methyl-D-erythritol 4-phosphate cytidylyltransferase n=1 Tax=Limosilactobacillus fermentum TaxID=1613 RepID=UPI0016513695|nr:2-C-methyl-D-erythritol 4-phosphate cytidylyltransferase [Limosilactobacillus fermentum]
MMKTAVIFAGGVGTRMHSKDIPKQFLKLHDKPIIVHTLGLFEESPEIDNIVVACLADYIDYLQKLVEQYNLKKVKKIVPGGNSGQESIYNGLKAAEEVGNREEDIVLIHDGVRPLINEKTIQDNIKSVQEHGSAITSVKAKETILVVDDEESIDSVPDRSHSRLARAPQSFYLNDILSAHERAIEENKYDFIDSCSMMTYYGHRLYLVDGPQENIKITTPDDFYTMRALLDAREDAQIYGLED